MLTNFLFLSLADQLNKLQIYNVKMRIIQESKVLKLCKVQGWQSETKQGSHLYAAAEKSQMSATSSKLVICTVEHLEEGLSFGGASFFLTADHRESTEQ